MASTRHYATETQIFALPPPCICWKTRENKAGKKYIETNFILQYFRFRTLNYDLTVYSTGKFKWGLYQPDIATCQSLYPRLTQYFS